ncbi:MAG: sporulation protein YqfD [Candidatus Improbicoccus devescovinae]|nr:MAG: sporulation protein YqfD [Candidatus Improbicoccus devescovinae]
MTVKLIRWFFGYVIFLIKGNRLEEFINNCARTGINIWDIAKTGEVICAKSISSEYSNLLKIAKKNGLEFRIEHKRGLPFFLQKYKSRLGLLIGIIIFLLNLNIFSLYIWNINVKGAENLNKNEIINVLKDLGVHPGALKKNIDSAIIKQLVMERLPQISWIAVNLDGSFADVLIKEKHEIPKLLKDNKTNHNIKAVRDGQVERIETYEGTVIIKPGDSVTKGQILITGSLSDDSEDVSGFADGKIWAKTVRKIREKIETKYNIKINTGNVKKKYEFKIFEFNIPLNFWENIEPEWENETHCKIFKIGTIELPMKFYKHISIEKIDSEVEITREQAIEKSEENANKMLNSEDFKNIKVLEKNSQILSINNEEFYEIKLKCLENIAISE